MPTWTIKAEPVNGAGVDEAMWEYFTDIGWRVLGRPATEAQLASGPQPASEPG